MTAVDDRTKIATFENLEVPEGWRVELLRGEIVMLAGPDWVHNINILLIKRQIPLERWYPLQTQDIAIPGEASEPQPDLVVHEHGAFKGPGRLLPAPAVTLVVEMVSKTSVHRDYVIKSSIYAAGRVPAYLIVDPIKSSCVLLTGPMGVGEEASYRTRNTYKFGESLPIEALDLTLDTSMLHSFPSA
ncbi:Uma2 family endonuclease [Streptomyces sp. NPDC020379]|uniref:Uma2 family endonuclease n=1 Tax=Streptomyces sp. NPDC020379 TaxID=3365071 RepID=UPI0037AC8268